MKKYIQRYFGNMALQRRLISYFIIVCLVPIVIIGTIAIAFSLNNTRAYTIDLSDSALEQIKNRIEGLQEETEITGLSLSKDPILHNTLNNPLLSSKVDSFTDLNDYIAYEWLHTTSIDRFYVINTDEVVFKSHKETIETSDIFYTPWYQTALSNTKPMWYIFKNGSLFIDESYEKYMTCIMPIIDSTSQEIIGILIMEINTSQLETLLYDSFNTLGQAILVDETNNLIASSRNIYDDESDAVSDVIALTSTFPRKRLYSENKMILINHYLYSGNWRVVGMIPWTLIYKDSLLSFVLLIVILILLTLQSFYISRLISNTITKPINHMIDQMEEVKKGHLGATTKVYYDDEIGALSHQFNEMTDTLTSLKSRVIEDQTKLRKSEFKALQSQINPHFLYNTLDSVVWLARMKQHDKIVDVVNALSRLFRISLSRGKDIITIEDEIDHVESYLSIQKQRYRSQFDYYIDVPDHLKQFKTLKLLIQPLVENAIYHGIKLKRDGGNIFITVRKLKDTLEIVVRDTGLGMEEDLLEGIHKSLNGESTNIQMYGIKNVHDRIKIYFGDGYGLRYESQFSEGTRAILTIPIYMGDDTHVKNNHN